MDKGWHLRIFDQLSSLVNLPSLAILASICWFTLFYAVFYFRLNFQTAYFRWIIFCLFLNIILSYEFGSVIYYNQTTLHLFSAIFWHGGITFYFFLMLFTKNLKPITVFNTILLYGFAACVFINIVYFSGMAENILSKDSFGERFGDLRIQFIADQALELLSCYLISFFLLRKEYQYNFFSKPILYFLTVIILIQTIVVNKTRSYIIGLILTIIVVSYFAWKLKISGRIIKFLPIILTIVLLALPFYFSTLKESSFVQSFNSEVTSEGSKNISIRIKGIQFYFGELVKTNFMGFGWVSNKEDSPDNPIKHAITKDNLFYVDLGFLGLFFMYGLLGLVVCFYFYKMSFGIIKSFIENGDPQERIMAGSIGVFLILQLTTLTGNQVFYYQDTDFFYALVMFILNCILLTICARLDPENTKENL